MIKVNFTTGEKLLFIIPIFGWVFIAYGVVFPIQNLVIRIMFYIDIVLSATHFIQIFVALPLGKKGGIPVLKNIFLTIALGSTWWKPLKKSVGEMK